VNTLMFAVWPYVALTIFVVGWIWRWRTDQYGWGTRTSELSEKKILWWASPTFHAGVLLVVFGHIAGLIVPKSWTTALGISEHAYHLGAVVLGTVSGLILLAGVVGLMLRRFVLKSRQRLITRPGDVVMYVVLAIQMVLGLTETIAYSAAQAIPGFDYRENVSIWFRSIFYLHPNTAAMAGVPLVFQLHAIAAFLFFAVWPFSRLVHVWSAPVGYLTRPPIVYRASVPR